eukprot:COSAG01_NODE_14263_length_1475_cov_1.771802_2_plen_262_part_01
MRLPSQAAQCSRQQCWLDLLVGCHMLRGGRCARGRRRALLPALLQCTPTGPAWATERAAVQAAMVRPRASLWPHLAAEVPCGRASTVLMAERAALCGYQPGLSSWRWAGSQEAIGSGPPLPSEERTTSGCLDESYQVCCVGHHQNARSGVLMVRVYCTVDAWITHQVEETPRSRAESAAAAVTAAPTPAARTPPRSTAHRATAAEAEPSPQLSSAAAPGWSRPGKGAVAEAEGADPPADHGAAGTRAASRPKISPPATAKPP